MDQLKVPLEWKCFFFLLFALTTFTNGYAQRKTKASIDTVRIEQEENKLRINFDLVNVKQKELFEFDIKVMTRMGEDMGARSFNQDWGMPVSLDKKKRTYQLSWDIQKDGHFFDEDLYVVVNANKVHKISPVKGSIMSIVFPGWGNNHIRPGRKWYFALGGLSYGSAAFSGFMEFKTRTSYQSYLLANNTGDRNRFFTSAREQRIATNVGMVVTGALWVGTLAWTLIESIRKRSKKYKGRSLKLSLEDGKGLLYANH